MDLRRPPPSDREVHFLYGTGFREGWCALTNTASGLSCGLRFDPEVFPCSWLFASYGGWRKYEVAVLEPCTGFPLKFNALPQSTSATAANNIQP